MKKFILDTGIAACYIDRRFGVYERAKVELSRGNRIGIVPPVLAELVYRIEGSPNPARNYQRLALALAAWNFWPSTREAAFEYGRIAFQMRNAGRTIGQNDIMIGAIALSLKNTTVVSMDGDMSLIPGLDVENWAQEGSSSSTK